MAVCIAEQDVLIGHLASVGSLSVFGTGQQLALELRQSHHIVSCFTYA